MKTYILTIGLLILSIQLNSQNNSNCNSFPFLSVETELSVSNNQLIADVIAGFPFGSGPGCPEVTTIDIQNGTSQIQVNQVYNTLGIWAAFFCTTESTYSFNISDANCIEVIINNSYIDYSDSSGYLYMIDTLYFQDTTYITEIYIDTISDYCADTLLAILDNGLYQQSIIQSDYSTVINGDSLTVNLGLTTNLANSSSQCLVIDSFNIANVNGQIVLNYFIDYSNELKKQNCTIDTSFTIFADSAYNEIIAISNIIYQDLYTSSLAMENEVTVDTLTLNWMNDFVSFSNDFVIYPNPVEDIVYLQNLGNFNLSKIEIVDIKGHIVFEKTTSTNYLNLDKLSSGVYFLKCYSDNIVTIKQILKY